MASVRNDVSGKGLIGVAAANRGIVALAAALTAVSLVESAYAGKNVQVDRVAKGTATFDQNGSVLTIRAGDRTVINYKRFDVANGETVRFIQPSRNSRVLNRINSAAPSRIDGTVTGNGIVYFVNPAGVIFGANSVINVGQFYAAAGTITDANFLKNINQFRATGSVVNEGVINADAVALIGRSVANAGTISAEGGLVTMVAGDDVLLGTRDGHIMVKLASSLAAAGGDAGSKGGVVNTGTVQSGSTMLAAGDLYSLAIGGSVKGKQVTAQGGGDVAVTGKIDASDASAGAKGGSVVVTGKNVSLQGATIDASGDAGGGSVLVGGDFHGQGSVPTATNTVVDNGTTITANATGNGDGGKVVVWSDNKTTYNGSSYAKGGSAGGNGGQVEVSGKGNLAFNGQVDTTAAKGAEGSLLLDPLNLTIQASNPDVHGDGSNQDLSTNIILSTDDPGANSVITSAQLVTLLVTTDVFLSATNDITVNTAVNASAGSHGLTLDAGHNVNVNQPIELNNANLTLNGGNRVNVSNTINTHGGDLFITSSAGDVINPFGGITANHLTIEAATGIGTSAQRIQFGLTGGIEAHAASGDIYLQPFGPIDLGFAGGTKGGVIADHGSVDVLGFGGPIYVRTAGHVVSASGNVALGTVISGDVVTDNFNGAGLGQVIAGGQVMIIAADNVTIGATSLGDVHAGTGLSIAAGGSGAVAIDNGSFVETDGGNVLVTAGTQVGLLQTNTDQAHLWNNGAGTVTIQAPSFVSQSGGSPAAVQAGGAVTVNADTVNFSDSITSSGGAVTFAPLTAGRGISLANSAVAGQLTLTGAELALVSGPVVQVGDANSGAISVAGTIVHGTGWNVLHLVTGDAVTESAGGTIQVGKLAVSAVNGVTLGSAANQVGTFAAVNTTAGGVSLTNASALSVGVVDGVSGVQAQTAGGVSVTAAGTISVATNGAVVSAPGDVRLVATGATSDVVTGGGQTAVESTGGNVTLQAGRDVAVGQTSYGDVLADGTLRLDAGRDVTIDNGSFAAAAGASATAAAGNSVQLLSTGGNTQAHLWNTGAGTVVVQAPSFVSQSGGSPASVKTLGGNVTITADTVSFTDAIDAGSGVVTFAPRTAGRGISLANSAVSGQLTLTGAELSLVSGSVVRVGSSMAGNISVAGTIVQGTGWNTLSLISGGGISDAAGGTLQVDNLAVVAVNAIDLSHQAHFVGTFAALNGTSGGVSLKNAQALTVGTVDGVSGVEVQTAGGVGLTAAGTISVATSGAAIVAPGDVSLKATGATADIVTGGQNSPAIQSTAGSVTLDAGRDVAIGQTDYGDVSAATGLTLTAGRDVTIDNGSFAEAAGGNVSVTAGNSVQLLQTSADQSHLWNGGTGSITISAPSFVANSGGTPASVKTAGGDITIKADTVDFSDAIDAGAGVVAFAPLTAARGISLADSAVPGQLTLTGSELALVSGSMVRIGSTAAGNISVAGTIAQGTGWNTLSLITGGGVSDAAGGTLQVANLVVRSGGAVSLASQSQSIGTVAGVAGGGLAILNATGLTVGSVDGIDGISATAAVTLTATTITLDENVSATGGAVTFNGPVVLGNTITVTGSDVTFNGTVKGSTDGGQTLNVANSGLAKFGDAVGGGGLALDSLDVSGAAEIDGASVKTAHGQVYHGAVTLGGSTTLTGTTVTFSSTVDDVSSGHALTLSNTGLATFGGAVGGTKPIYSLAVSGPVAINGGSVKTTGSQTYSGAVAIGADATLGGAAIAFGSTVDGAHALALQNTGAATFGGAVGGTTQLTSLSVSGASTIGGGSVKTTGDQTYTGAVTLANTTSLTGQAITFGSTVDGSVDGGQALTLNNTGVATFGNAVGGTKKLSLLSVSGATTASGGSIVTTGDQTYNGAFVVGSNLTLTGDHVTFASTVRGLSDGGQSLTVANASAATFNGTVGTGGKLSSLTVNGPAVLKGGLVATTGGQDYKGAVALKTDTAMAGGTITFESTVDGAVGLTLANSGTARFDGAVGAAVGLSSLMVGGPVVINGGQVITTGGQAYNGAVTLGADTTMNGTAIGFGSTLDAASPGAQGLTLHNTAVASFGGTVGGTAKLKFLTVDGATVLNGPGITTAGTQSYGGAVTVGANATLTGAAITFVTTVDDSADGAHTLTLTNSGLATLGGVVGGTHKLGSLSISGTSVIGSGSVTTASGQAYSGAVTLVKDTNLNAGADVSFGSAVDGAVVLHVTSGSGTAIFAGNVGGTTALKGLSTSGATKFGTHGASTAILVADANNGSAADVSVGGALTVAGDVKVQVVSGVKNGIKFGGDIDGEHAGQDTLTVLVPWHERTDDARGNVLQLPLITFAGTSVGSRSQLRALRLNATQAVDTGNIVADTDPAGGINGTKVPLVATVFAPGGLDVHVAEDFTMGRNEKLTVGSGDLAVTAGTTATVGDLNAPGDITVTAPQIVFQQRPAASVYMKRSGLTQSDQGLDFVAGGNIRFTGTFVETGTGTVSFSYGGDTDPGIVKGQLTKAVVRKLGTPLNASDMTTTVAGPDGPVVVALDFPPTGPSIVDPATTIAGATHVTLPSPGNDPGISASQMAMLAQIGINARDLTDLEILDGLSGRDIFVQAPGGMDIAAGRLSSPVVTDVLNTYATFFMEEQKGAAVDGQTAQVDMRAHMHEVLNKALAAYKAEHAGADFDPVAFRTWCETKLEQKGAADVLNKLRTLLVQIEYLGLTPREMAQVKAELFKGVKPDGVSTADFVKAVMGRMGQ